MEDILIEFCKYQLLDFPCDSVRMEFTKQKYSMWSPRLSSISLQNFIVIRSAVKTTKSLSINLNFRIYKIK